MKTLFLTDAQLTQIELALYARIKHADVRAIQDPSLIKDVAFAEARHETEASLRKVMDAKLENPYAKPHTH